MTRFRLVEAEAAQFPVSLLCRVVGVTRQGFYAWKRRPPSARELADRKLAKRIREIYTETDEIYGAPRVYSELKLGDGIPIGKKRVAPNPPFPRTRTESLGGLGGRLSLASESTGAPRSRSSCRERTCPP